MRVVFGELRAWKDLVLRGSECGGNAMGQGLSTTGSALGHAGLPPDPADWADKHKVKAALAMFDAYDKNNDDVLDSEELHLLFRDFACELKLFYDVHDDLAPSPAGIDMLVNQLRPPDAGATLSFLQFLPMFLTFTSELIAQAADHRKMGM